MRTYGRVLKLPENKLVWVVVETDANGYNDAVWLTTLAQVLQLNLGESPFWANYGIPARPSVLQQIFPDYYVALTQQRFSAYFASLIIARIQAPEPTYRVSATTNQGARLNLEVPT